MTQDSRRLSVPKVRRDLPRPLADREYETFELIADALCCGNGDVPPPSECSEFRGNLDLAVATRSDSFDLIIDQLLAASRTTDIDPWLRQLHDEDAESFFVLSTVVSGAYLLVPRVREAIGYRGQYHDIPGIMEAVDELSDGILDPVLERGYIYVPTPE